MTSQFVRVALILSLLAPALQDKRLSPPTAAEQKAAETEIKALFKDEFAKKDRESRRAFAQTLLSQALDAKNTPASRYVVLMFARDASSESMDFATAFEAVDQLERIYELGKPPLAGASYTSDVTAQKAAVLNGARKFATSPGDGTILAEAYLKLARSALQSREFDDASSAAEQCAKASKDPTLISRAVEMQKEIPELKKEEDLYTKAKETLTAKPEDPDANLVVGRYLLFVLNDEDAGRGCLTKGADAALREVIKKEAPGTLDSQGLFEAGEAWFVLGEKEKSLLQKKRYLVRARMWYEKSLQDAPGLLKIKIQKRIDEMGTKGTSETAGIDILRAVDPKKDTFAGSWERDGSKIKVVKGTFSRLELPYEPADEYDVKAVFEAGPSTEAVLLLTRGGKGFALGLTTGQGRGGLYNSLKSVELTGLKIPPSLPHTVLVQVRTSSIKVTIDGTEVQEWRPEQKTLGHHVAWAPRNAKALGIGANGEPVVFQSISVVEVSGRGKRLRQ